MGLHGCLYSSRQQLSTAEWPRFYSSQQDPGFDSVQEGAFDIDDGESGGDSSGETLPYAILRKPQKTMHPNLRAFYLTCYYAKAFSLAVIP